VALLVQTFWQVVAWVLGGVLALPIWLLSKLIGKELELRALVEFLATAIFRLVMLLIVVGGSAFGLYHYTFVQRDTTGMVIFGALCAFFALATIQNLPEWWDDLRYWWEDREWRRAEG
jgi:hypothetical protein